MTTKPKTINFTNGVRIAHAVKVGTPSIGIRIYAGTLSDPVGQCGIAHFIEHLIMVAPTQQGEAFMNAAKQYCSAIRATTHHDFIQFSAAIKNPEAIPFLLNGIFNARLDEADFASEKSFILEELKQRQSFDIKQSRHVMDIYGDGDYACLWGGEYDAVKTISPTEALAFYQNIFKKSAVEIVLIGNIDPKPIEAFFADKKLPAPALDNPPIKKGMVYRAGSLIMPAYGHLHPDYALDCLAQNVTVLAFAKHLEGRGITIEHIEYGFYDIGLFALAYWHIEKPFNLSKKVVYDAFRETLNNITEADFIAGYTHMTSGIPDKASFSEEDFLLIPQLWINHFHTGDYWENFSAEPSRFTWADYKAYIDTIKKAL